MRGHFWTEADLDRLRREYHATPNHELAGLLGRSASALCVKATKMGLRKSYVDRAWTAGEVLRVRREFPVTRTHVLAASMGRPPEALRRRATALGIKKADNATRARVLDAQGVGRREIAGRLGLTLARIHQILPPRPADDPPPPRPAARPPATSLAVLLAAYEANPTDALRAEVETRILATTNGYADTARWRYVVDRFDGLKKLRLAGCVVGHAHDGLPRCSGWKQGVVA